MCTRAHRVHSAEQVFGDIDGETDGLCCPCGRPGLLRAQEGQSKRFEDRKCVGSGGACGKQRVISASTLHLIIGHCNCLLLGRLSVGSAPVLFISRGRHGRIRHQPDLTWVCWWRQVTEEEVHLCRAVAAGHNFYFFSALWGKATSRWRCRRLVQCC